MDTNEDAPKVEANDAIEVKKPSFFSRFVKKHPVITAVFLGLLAVVLVYFWKDIEGNYQRKAVVEVATTQLQDNNQLLLKLISKPLVWNIRAEMLRGNMEQIDLLMNNLVKEKNFQFIHLVEPDGNVILSTNKQMQGQSLDNGIIWKALLNDSTVVLVDKANIITVVAPVMGFDERMATLVIGYQSQPFQDFQVKK